MQLGQKVEHTSKRMARAVEILGRHQTIGAAMVELAEQGVCATADALHALMRRQGVRPSDLLAPTAVRDFVDRRPEPDAAPPDQYDDDDGPPTLRDGWTLRPEPPFRAERILFVPDAHWPYVDRPAWALAMRCAAFFQPHHVVVLGDAIDCLSISQYDKSPGRHSNLADELDESRQMLDDLDAIGAERKHYLMGNHEFRLDRLIQRTPGLFKLRGLSVHELLDLGLRGWTHSAYQEEYRIGTLRVSHDYGLHGSTALRKALATVDYDIVHGHTHRVDHQERVSRDGHTVFGDTFGWLGSLDGIDYRHRAMARAEWKHAIGAGYTRADGSVRREAVRFVNGEAKIDGQRV